jgi:hypothetical protein
MQRSTRPLAALAALLILTAGACERATSRPPPGPSQASGTGSPGPYTRRATVPAAGLRPQWVEFADAERGYALFTGCTANGCRGALFVSLNGGHSWLGRALPVTEGRNIQLYVVDAATIAVLVEPSGWYVSRDFGRSFIAYPPDREPAIMARLGLGGGVQARCPGGGDACAQRRVVAVDVEGAEAPVPAQPALPGELLRAQRGGDGRIWAVSAAADAHGNGAKARALHTAVSTDRGQTWRRLTPVTGEAPMLQLAISADGRDVWLAASPGVGWPSLWRYDDERGWLPVGVRRDAGQHRVAVAAAGDGTLAVAVRDRLGLIVDRGTRWVEPEPPVPAGWVSMLADGTLLASINTPGEIWLGTGAGARRDWVRVVITAE